MKRSQSLKFVLDLLTVKIRFENKIESGCTLACFSIVGHNAILLNRFAQSKLRQLKEKEPTESVTAINELQTKSMKTLTYL